MPNNPIQSPAGYVPSRGVAFADVDSTALMVSTAMPLPVTTSPAAVAALTGSAAATAVLGPFQPAAGRAIMLALSGTWVGTVKLVRSTDGGTTKLPLTINGTSWAQFTTNCCEAVWEESDSTARFYLDVTLTSGTLAYRLAQ
jgi:hypothetical protein